MTTGETLERELRAGALALLGSRPGQWLARPGLLAAAPPGPLGEAALADAMERLTGPDMLAEEREAAPGDREWRLLDLDAPVGPGEIARWLRVRRGTVDKWRQRGIFPAPEPDPVGGRPWWKRETVRDWAIATGRAPGRAR